MMISPCSSPRAAADLEEEEEEEVVIMDPLLGAGKEPGRGRCQAGPKTGAQPWVPVRGASLPPHVPLFLLRLERPGSASCLTLLAPAQMKIKSNLPLLMFSS